MSESQVQRTFSTKFNDLKLGEFFVIGINMGL